MEQHPPSDPVVQFINNLIARFEPMIQEFYAANPLLHDFAEQRAQGCERQVCSLYGADEQTNPAAPTLRSAFRRLVFAFTNLHDYSDTFSGAALAQELFLYRQALTTEAGPPPSLEKIATHFSFWTLRMFVAKAEMDMANELDGFSSNEQFRIVKTRLELIDTENYTEG